MPTVDRPSTDARDGFARPAPIISELPLPPMAEAVFETESQFYRRYRWCLDAFPTVAELKRRLSRELSALEEVDEGWPRDEVQRNVFLLSCALADSVDDHLAGEGYDFSQAEGALPPVRHVTRTLQSVLGVGRRHHQWRLRRLRAWREAWSSALDAFLRASLAAPHADPFALSAARERLTALLAWEAPAGLMGRRSKAPAAFRTQDLTHHDIFALAFRFAAAFPDVERPRLVIGLRTAGSYFAPLVRAWLSARGYRDVEAVTLRPKKGITPWEQAALARCAARRGQAVIVDEPADTGTTVGRVVDILRRTSVPAGDVVALLPVHPTRRHWQVGDESLPLSRIRVITLEPEDWHKEKLLAPAAVEERLRPYLRARGYRNASVVAGPAAERFNGQLRRLSEEKFHSRLKRVYEVRLVDHAGRAESRYVLAKSVGWGWLSYHAFVAAEALADFVPPMLGLRDGILFTEWLPQSDQPALPLDRGELARRVASYVAARVRRLGLEGDPGPDLDPQNQKGSDLLACALSQAYGWKPAAVLKRARIRHELSRRPCPVPTFIDAKMRRQEWIQGPVSLLKTDFEHHGMGKTELNVTDPAYDLAEAILHLNLSPAEEQLLLQRYREASGDEGVEERLFLHKLLAGTAARVAALANLADPRLRHRHDEFNRSYIEAWDFLTTHTVRFCGGQCRPAAPAAWRSPLVVMDIDGVLDKQIFGFPSTSAAGMEAVALLHAHGLAVALNTARALADVQEYCRAYGCVGGVAEYGSVVWDAVTDRTHILVTPESRDELQRLAQTLRQIPGVFLNDGYQHSLRAYTYDRDRTAALPSALIHGLIADLGLQRVTVRQTYLDTTVLAKEIDKGKGLLELLSLAGCPDAETIAIGDSEPDLAMFRVAGRSFAPRHIAPRSVARLLGCHIASRSFQPGLLSAVRSIVHPGGGRCSRCRSCRPAAGGQMFGQLLKVADRNPVGSLLWALADPMALRTFVR